jgi:integrase
MSLTDAAARNARPGAKAVRLFDAKGLYLEISPSGGKWWRLKYRVAGREKRLSLGVYPEINLRAARKKRDDARELIGRGVDPGERRKIDKALRVEGTANSLEAVAREWYAKYSPGWASSHSSKVLRRLERDVFPWSGSRPIAEIEPAEILATLRRVEGRGALETAHRALQNVSQVFRYAVATGRAKSDPTRDLRGALPPADVRHHPTITEPKAIGALLRMIDGYAGSPVTKAALRLAPLTFVRPGELRRAEWTEFDLDGAEWRIPAERMKMRAPHVVPLSSQAVAVLRDLAPLTGHGRYVFPGARSSRRPMSENTVNAALRNLGYTKEQMTGHGFRSMASTLLNEQGWHRDAIERQLAHAERDEIRAAYNYAEHLPERRKMMQAWADYLQRLQAGATVVSLPRAAA